jgi:hypothetical protein
MHQLRPRTDIHTITWNTVRIVAWWGINLPRESTAVTVATPGAQAGPGVLNANAKNAATPRNTNATR